MGERTSYPHGTFCWVDNATTEQERAKAFYASLFGWTYDDRPVDDGVTYSMALLDGKPVAAIAPQQQDEAAAGIPPHWNSYVTVDDVDAASTRVDPVGGRLHMDPFDVMDAGRMTVVGDPTGAVFCLWQPKNHPGARVVNTPGSFCWNELGTRDAEAAQRFYSELLGWRFEQIPDIPVPYWTIWNGDRANGGMRLMGDETPAEVPPYWLVYFGVEEIDPTVLNAAGIGGQLIVPKTPVGGENSFAVMADPAGAVFGLFEGAFDD